MYVTRMHSYSLSDREARRHKRINRPNVDVYFENKAWRPLNWSLGGLLIRPYEGSLEPDHVVRGMIVGTTYQGQEKVPFTARVVRRIDRRKELALQFAPADDQMRRFFDRYVQSLGRQVR